MTMAGPLIALSQRVDRQPGYGELRDALDQRWAALLDQCGLVPAPVPNGVASLDGWLERVRPQGVLLTGGNNPPGGEDDAPGRYATERSLIEYSRERFIPLLGVCHGMQMLLHDSGARIEPVEGHVTSAMSIRLGDAYVTVNSYHDFGVRRVGPEFDVWGIADDGVIKAVRHRQYPWTAIMWHPERMTPFAERDIALIQTCFGMDR